ncbi:MAG: hypothetical protein KF833_10835 [Verrucomicrobiae bacterium]|nr:hypothetical protein [Verrucomicrobiae bacterium]
MPSGSSSWTWNEIAPFARILADLGAPSVVCGGQAVAFWAARFGLGAIVSRDLDVLGERDGADRLAATLGGTIQYPHRYEMTVLAAVIRTTWRGRPLDIEWLHSVPGIEADPEAISVLADLGEGHLLRVLHPVPLAAAKLHAIRFFDQRGRNDAAHLKVVVQVIGYRVTEELDLNPALALGFIHRWYRAARLHGNRRVLAELAIDWRHAVPVEELHRRASRDPRVARFLSEHWPRLSAEI